MATKAKALAAPKKKKKDTGSGKPRKDKLGVTAGQRVHLVGAHAAAVKTDVRALGATLTDEVRDADWIL